MKRVRAASPSIKEKIEANDDEERVAARSDRAVGPFSRWDPWGHAVGGDEGQLWGTRGRPNGKQGRGRESGGEGDGGKWQIHINTHKDVL